MPGVCRRRPAVRILPHGEIRDGSGSFWKTRSVGAVVRGAAPPSADRAPGGSLPGRTGRLPGRSRGCCTSKSGAPAGRFGVFRMIPGLLLECWFSAHGLPCAEGPALHMGGSHRRWASERFRIIPPIPRWPVPIECAAPPGPAPMPHIRPARYRTPDPDSAPRRRGRDALPLGGAFRGARPGGTRRSCSGLRLENHETVAVNEVHEPMLTGEPSPPAPRTRCAR